MSRPAGEPGVVAAGARRVGAAAGSLRDVQAGLRGATSFVVVAGAWRGPASEAFLIDGAGLQTGLERAAGALDHAAGALAELAARLEHAQATWDRARQLAASAGVELDPRGGILPPSGGVDAVNLSVAGQAVRLAAAADQDAAAARRTAAARLDHAASLVSAHRASAAQHGPANGRAVPVPGGTDPHGPVPGGTGHEAPWRRAAARALETGVEVATATHHLAAGAEARLRAAGRLAATANDPAVRSAAARVAGSAGRPLVDGRVLHTLPLVAPVLDLAAGVSEGQPLPRALSGAIGGAVGADLGGRVGLAVCGGQAAATQGVGLVVCPALTAVGGAVGAHAGKETALHLYDKIAGPPDHPSVPRSPP